MTQVRSTTRAPDQRATSEVEASVVCGTCSRGPPATAGRRRWRCIQTRSPERGFRSCGLLFRQAQRARPASEWVPPPGGERCAMRQSSSTPNGHWRAQSRDDPAPVLQRFACCAERRGEDEHQVKSADRRERDQEEKQQSVARCLQRCRRAIHGRPGFRGKMTQENTDDGRNH